jgi:hypothetical protein
VETNKSRLRQERHARVRLAEKGPTCDAGFQNKPILRPRNLIDSENTPPEWVSLRQLFAARDNFVRVA